MLDDRVGSCLHPGHRDYVCSTSYVIDTWSVGLSLKITFSANESSFSSLLWKSMQTDDCHCLLEHVFAVVCTGATVLFSVSANENCFAKCPSWIKRIRLAKSLHFLTRYRLSHMIQTFLHDTDGRPLLFMGYTQPVLSKKRQIVIPQGGYFPNVYWNCNKTLIFISPSMKKWLFCCRFPYIAHRALFCDQNNVWRAI